MSHLPTLCVLLLIGSLGSARAAESYENCSGFIDSVPATITTQGTWCLHNDLATAITSGIAIRVQANNVTLDCNDFKIGGLAAGVSTNAYGIHSDKLNTTVRNCAVRGFYVGIQLYGDGHVAEQNRLEANTWLGIETSGDGNTIRNNMVNDTGGRPAQQFAYAIAASGVGARVLGNSINGVTPTGNIGLFSPVGIRLINGIAQGNQISGLVTGNSEFAEAIGIDMFGKSIASDNRLIPIGSTAVQGFGIRGAFATDTACVANVVVHYSGGISTCSSAGNVVVP
ncbi:MAG TPA: hypothetical protein VGD21_10830 [Lysobacter sp.]